MTGAPAAHHRGAAIDTALVLSRAHGVVRGHGLCALRMRLIG